MARHDDYRLIYALADRVLAFPSYPRPGRARVIMPSARILAFSESPVIDIAPLVGAARRREAATVAAIAGACQDVGFFYVRNHGVPAATLDRLVAQAKVFFALTSAEKKSVSV